MSLSKLQNTFIIFFENLPDIPASKRLVRMRQFLENGIDANIEVLENLIIPIKFQYSAIITVKAENKIAVEKALELAKGEFKIDVFQPEDHERNSATNQFNCCILTQNLENSTIEAWGEGDMDVHSVIKLPESSSYKQLLLVNTQQMVDVFRYSGKHLKNSYPYISQVTSISDYLEDCIQKPTNEVSEAASSSNNPQATGDGNILNQGTNTVYYADTDSVNPNLSELIKNNRKEIISTGNQPVQSNVHFWENLGGKFRYELGYFRGNSGSEYFPMDLSTNAPIPSKVNTVGKNDLLAFNLPSNEPFHVVSEVGIWLNELLNTTIHDSDWPEEHYTGDKQDAYNNIIEQLVAKDITSLPRDGGMDSDDFNCAVKYPTDGKINREAFDSVVEHLTNEISYVTVHAERWFGGSGYFNSLTNSSSLIAQLDINIAAGNMNLPSSKPQITVVLDAIFGELLSVISLIPEAGGTLSTVLGLAWSTAKRGMDAGESTKSITSSIEGLEVTLLDYLKVVESSNSKHLTTITSNWGKLQNFSKADINLKKINPEMFGLKAKADGDKADTPLEYVDAVEKAWRIICYKALYPGHFTITNNLSYSKDQPTPIFNREKRAYHFSYYLKCMFLDASGIENEGWAEMTYINDAPIELLDDLFGKDGLNLNPIEFYLGYNGWKSQLPKYDNKLRVDSPWKKVYL